MEDRNKRALALVKYHSYASGALGLIPVPGADVAAVSAAQLNMIHKLAKLYGVEFAQERTRAIVVALLGGVMPGALSGSVLGSAVKAVPFLGTALGMAVMPALSLAATQALGRVFIQHFETGGTLLDFDTEAMREHFRREFEQAKAENPETSVDAPQMEEPAVKKAG
ncbi:YcjF family protein [Azospirillum sp.]|uniref:YcjF family protein n=1 Tax=Azospirillum sp. TaxID=34012 RepID=UPI003D702ECC